ncbi:hypothetical protein GGTG_12493 [Gaeumannomyces tritici R3-111a-1]|uniref:DUF1742-domain-containing protein n=1 Tax=Gaeumannomyces tritici (strain R3-111a-1) TaxID=644352 RepID=J3PG67_GAET3|nr:hypothetical protein GGTG_12493 [Gaeumannomyces tritici R3-111a-1]EJT70321.1 hypothetical protein GGTG_12493 [Gaeumannomyces tritici R3-111a-1]
MASAAPFPNVYTRRLVADTAAKGCDICYKPSTTVLITPNKQDFFYVCPIHLKDANFASPIVDQAAIDAKNKKELDDEVERLKKEYEERQKKKKEKEEEAKEGDGKNDKDKEKKEEEKDDKKDSKKDEPSAKDNASKSDGPATPPAGEEPRVFALRQGFYNARVDKKRQIETNRRNRERLTDPNFFPAVPKGKPV